MRKLAALALSALLCATPTSAGIIVRGTEGLVMTGADGVFYENTSGLVMTGADGLLGLQVNGISQSQVNGLVMTGADGVQQTGHDGLVMTGADGLVMTGADGLVMTGADSNPLFSPAGLVMTGADGVNYRAESADGISVGRSDGLVMTGADGLVMTGADGTTYEAASVSIRRGDGLVMTGADGLVMTGADGVEQAENSGLVMTGADGLVMTGADAVQLQNAQSVMATRTDGTTYAVPPAGLVMTGADGLVMTGADAIRMTNVAGLVMTGADGLVMTGADRANGTGLVSIDPSLASTLETMTDDSNVNAAIIYHNPVTDADIADLQRIGITGGTRFRALPVVVLTATKEDLFEVSKLPTVRALYGNTTLQWSAEDKSRLTTGLARTRSDADLVRLNGGVAPKGSGVTVAVIDTGLDSRHPDLAGRVAQNVKLADLGGANLYGFNYPVNVENLANTDLVYGHGTFVGGIIAGNSTRTGGRLSGYAPGARLVGLGAGDASLFHVLAGFDYVLQHKDALNIRVVNCSFSSNTVFNVNDPVNVATKMLAERGVTVVFSAGNAGPGANSLNPYAAAPWVVSVAATDERGRPASFSSRGVFGSTFFRPTLTAPGVNVVSARSSGVSVTGALGLGSTNDLNYIAPLDLPYYTTGSGTSFTAPQVAGTIALMLEANPKLTPSEVRALLQRTATPLPPFYPHEVGAGMLNSHAAVLAAAFPQRHIGQFKTTLDRGQVQFVKESYAYNGTAHPGAPHETTFQMPRDTLSAFVQVGWGPETSPSDLAVTVVTPTGARKDVNTVNLPGLTGKRERVTLSKPATGPWRVRVGHALGAIGSSQKFEGVIEVTRVSSAGLGDVDALSGTQSFDEVVQALRTFVMFPTTSGSFNPHQEATRGQLAAALVLGARVPLYVPAQTSYTDLYDDETRNYVESARFAPVGALFPSAAPGTAFQPSAAVDRLTAAVALVRAAGLRAEAESTSTPLIMLRDGHLIPGELNGYVYVALARGLMTAPEPDLFNPRGALTRADLAHSLAVIEKMYSE